MRSTRLTSPALPAFPFATREEEAEEEDRSLLFARFAAVIGEGEGRFRRGRWREGTGEGRSSPRVIKISGDAEGAGLGIDPLLCVFTQNVLWPKND